MKRRTYQEATDYIISQIREMPIPDMYKLELVAMLSTLQTIHEVGDPYEVVTNLYDVVEEHDNCHVQVLKNSVTGDISVGWYENVEEGEDDE